MEIQKSCSSWVPAQEPAPSKSDQTLLAGPTCGFSPTHPKSIPNPPSSALPLDTTSSLLHDGQPIPEVPLSPRCLPGWRPPDSTSLIASAGARTILGLVPPQGSTPKTRPFLHRQFCRKIPAAGSWRICFALLCQFVGARGDLSQHEWPLRPRQGWTWHGPPFSRCITADELLTRCCSQLWGSFSSLKLWRSCNKLFPVTCQSSWLSHSQAALKLLNKICFLEESISSGAEARLCYHGGPLCHSSTSTGHLCPACSPVVGGWSWPRAAEVFSAGSRTSAVLGSFARLVLGWPEDPTTEHKGGDEDRWWRNEDNLQLSFPVHGLCEYGASGNRAEAGEKLASHPQYLEWPGFGVDVPSWRWD